MWPIDSTGRSPFQLLTTLHALSGTVCIPPSSRKRTCPVASHRERFRLELRAIASSDAPAPVSSKTSACSNMYSTKSLATLPLLQVHICLSSSPRYFRGQSLCKRPRTTLKLPHRLISHIQLIQVASIRRIFIYIPSAVGFSNNFLSLSLARSLALSFIHAFISARVRTRC